MPKVLIIGNPISGGGRAGLRMAQLAEIMRERKWEVETLLTKAAGDGRRRAGEVDDDVDAIVCAGGDGTINEVVNGLKDPSAIPLSMLPNGTANLLAKELRLPSSAVRVADLLENPRIRRIDLCLANERKFLLLLSAGFDAMVCETISRCRKGTLGYLGYVKPIINTLGAYRPPRVMVEVDNHPPVEGALVVVSSIKNYGGIFSITDRAECDSGELDVCVFENGSIPSLVGYAAAALARRASGLRTVTYLRGKSIKLNGSQAVATELDGDYFAHTPVEISVQRAVVPILVPAHRPGEPWTAYHPN